MVGTLEFHMNFTSNVRKRSHLSQTRNRTALRHPPQCRRRWASTPRRRRRARAVARRRRIAATGMRTPRGRLIGRRPRAPSPTPRAATRRTPRTAASPSLSSSSLLPPQGAPTARPRALVAPSLPRPPRPSCYAAARKSGSSSSVRPRPPRSGRRAPPTRSSSVPCSSPTPTGTTPSSRRDRWRTPSWRNEPALPPDRYPKCRLKVSYKAFEEAELAKLKEEKPGLTLHQCKYMIWKLWKKISRQSS